MRELSEKISYLQGLAEGLNISDSSPQGKIITGILGVMDEITDEIGIFRSDFNHIKEYVECIDEDLFELEESFLNDEEDCIEATCPKCGEELYFDAEVLEDEDVIEIICPECNEVVFINDGSLDYNPAYIDDQEVQKNSPS